MRLLLLRLRSRGRLTVGRGVTVGRHARVRVAPGARVTLGQDTRIGERLTVEAVAGHVRIGPHAWLGDEVRILARADVTIAERCVLHDGATLLTSLPAHVDPDAPAARRAPHTAAVTLGPGARLREGAAVEPGVAIAAGAEVGAREVAGSDPSGPQTAAPSRSA
ncbi:MAG TPA: hypothetical protein VGV40_05585 [Solirubrobacteraceae bacterium]|nr:hypothetical protein [Solirubrobacteraceae bacterium]